MALLKSPALRLESIPSFRPKSGLYAVRRQAVRSIVISRAAEADSNFQFNYDEAKKNNEYTRSDVEAALKYYYTGQGVPPVHDAKFVTNRDGTEDARYFDDIEDYDVWEADEYQAVGIPEAAPDTQTMERSYQDFHDYTFKEDTHARDGAEMGGDNLTAEQDAYSSAEQEKLWEWLNDDNEDLTVGEELLRAVLNTRRRPPASNNSQLVGESLEADADAGVQGQAVDDEPAFDEITEEEEKEEEEEEEEEEEDYHKFQHRVLEVRRVTKVVKGGRVMGFRCVAAVGNGMGLVGAGCGGGREVSMAVKRAVVDARKQLIRVPIVGDHRTIPHRVEAKFHAGRVLMMPAAAGAGIVAGGVMRAMLELAGVKNCVAKRLGSRSPLNTARATIKAMQALKTLEQVAEYREVPVSELGRVGMLRRV